MKNLLISLRPSMLAAVAGIALVLGATSSALAKPPEPVTGTVDVKTGMTSVVFDEAFTAALTGLNSHARKIIPGQFIKGHQKYRFPIRGGAFDLNSLQAEIIHSGGVNFSIEGVSLSLTDFIITLPAVQQADATEEPATDPVTGEPVPVEPAPVPTLTALVVVNGQLLGRIELFNVALDGAGLTAPHSLARNKKFALADLPLTLTAEGAEALNTAFGVTTFVEGSAVGAASVQATTAKRPL